MRNRLCALALALLLAGCSAAESAEPSPTRADETSAVVSTTVTTTNSTTSTSSTTTAPPETTAPASTQPPAPIVTAAPAPPIPVEKPVVEPTTTTAPPTTWLAPPPTRNVIDCDGVLQSTFDSASGRHFSVTATTLTPATQITVNVTYANTTQIARPTSDGSGRATATLTFPADASKSAVVIVMRDGGRTCNTQLVW